MTNVTIVGQVLEVTRRIGSDDKPSIRMKVQAGPVKGLDVPCIVASRAVRLKDVGRGTMVSLTGELERDHGKLIVAVKSLEVLYDHPLSTDRTDRLSR